MTRIMRIMRMTHTYPRQESWISHFVSKVGTKRELRTWKAQGVLSKGQFYYRTTNVIREGMKKLTKSRAFVISTMLMT
jgi:hypothetical protein